MAKFDGLDPAIAAELSCHDLISIDVFDTIVLRAVSKPVDVFTLVSLIVAGSIEGLPHSDLLAEFPHLRVQAERLAREANRAANLSSEVTFDEIYCKLESLLPLNPRLLAVLKAAELEVETRLAYPNPLVKSIWAAALGAGKKVVFCSDMYLPSEFIAQLLKKCGCDRYDGLFVSCEHQRSKHEGTFLPYIAAKYRIPTDRVLHFGDNLHSDFVMARQAGCAGLHLPLAPPPDRELVIGGHVQPPGRDEAVNAIRQGLTNKLTVSLNGYGDDPCERIGYAVFGPLLTGFLLWLASRARERRPERILLFARDTHLLRKYLPRFLAAARVSCDIHYLYVSRAGLLLPSFTDFPLSRLWHLFSGKVPKSVAYHLRKLGLVPELFTSVIQSCGYQSLDDLVQNGERRMYALLAKLHRELLLESALRRPLVKRYLSRFTEGAHRFMAVDVGWVGNMQSSFLRILAPLPDEFDLRGYYVGLHSVARENDYPGHVMEGWLLHYGEPEGMEQGVWWSGGVELLEFAMCAPHGTTLGYAESDNGDVEPVLELDDWDAGNRALRSRLQQGMERFVREYCDTHPDVPASLVASRDWAREFYRFVTNPEPWEAEALGDVMHSDEAGGTRLRLPLAPRLDAAGRQDLASALRSCYWKPGLAARNDLRDAPEFKA